MNIGSYVYKLKDAFQKTSIPIAEGTDLQFNQWDTLKRINLYKHEKFLEREDGIFWSLGNPRKPQFAKLLELDTKDLQPYGVGEVNFYQAWILRMKFYRWLQDNRFALKLNYLAEGIADQGSMVWKKRIVKGKTEVEEVNLAKLFFDPTVEDINDSDIIEMHELSLNDLRAKADVWDNVEQVIEKIIKDNGSGIPKAEVWEITGHIPLSETSTDTEYRHVIGYGQGEDTVELFNDEDVSEDDKKYCDFHLGRYMGRWMRVGVYERLFKLQERANQLVNQNAQVSEIASLLLLRSADPNMSGNVLTQVENGQVIPSADLQQIAIQNPGIGNFIQELQLIERQADKLCMTPEVITGEQLPSGTPFRSLAVMTNAAKSAFKPYRENIGEKIGYLLKEDIFPAIVKEWNKGELFDITGDEQDVRVFDELLKARAKRDDFINNLLNGIVKTPEDLQLLDQQIENDTKRNRSLEIPKGYFNFDFGIKTNITGEEVDKAQKNDAYFNALTMSSQNPGLINTPLFKQYLEDNGIQYWKLTPEQLQQVTQNAVQGQPMVKGKTDALMAQVNP